MASTDPLCEVCTPIALAGTLPKRLVILCDGTFCATDQGVESNAGNIARLSRMIANVGLSSTTGQPIPQIAYYQSGLGTGWLSYATKSWQGAFGDGLNEKVCEAYTFLANNYGPGDEIFLFGFSRGAYTARSLAGFLCQVGLLTPGMMDYFDEIFNVYKTRKADEFFEDTAWVKEQAKPGELGLETNNTTSMTRLQWIQKWAHLHIKVKVVGVFDTVGSLGMSGWVDQPGKDTNFYSTYLHPKIENAFHAIALDEHRGNFPPTLWYMDEACKEAGVKLRQCWFPGYHGDIGGHSDAKSETNSVDAITFSWMVDQLDGLLQINRASLEYPILSRTRVAMERKYDDMAKNEAGTKPPQNPEQVNERRIQWSDGRLEETDGWGWWAGSMIATRRGFYRREPGVYHAIADGTTVDYRDFNEEIHPCVWHRMEQKELAYRPQNLSDWTRVTATNGVGFEWVRSVKGEEEIRLREYVIPKIPGRDMRGKNVWTGSLERVLAPQDYLLNVLDEANGL